MIFARRVSSRNGRDEWSEDFEGVEVPRAAKVAMPFDDSTPDYRRRVIKLRAVKVLRDNGFNSHEAALAVGMSPRGVRRYSGLIRELAKESGRV